MFDLGHVESGDFRPERDEAPEPGVFGDHVPFLAHHRVLADFAVRQVRKYF